jgi:hypothetical protein
MVSTVRQRKKYWEEEKTVGTFYVSTDGVQAHVFFDLFKPINVIMQLDEKVIGANAILSNLFEEQVQFVSDEHKLFVVDYF